MLIGIMSDSHNDAIGIKQAIDFFNLRNVDLVLHCGDFCLPECAAIFKNLKCGFRAVYGNNDFERTQLDRVISQFGIIEKEPSHFQIKGKNFIMSHRPMPLDFSSPIQNDFIIYGHTHRAKIQISANTTIINPGEICGWRSGKKTIALIDLETNSSEIFDLPISKQQ
jgi:putative phosphoesterase